MCKPSLLAFSELQVASGYPWQRVVAMLATDLMGSPKISWGLWREWIAKAWPLFLGVLPLYLVVTFSFAVVSVGLLLVLGQTVFHVFSLASPLIFLVLAICMSRAGILSSQSVLKSSVGQGSPWRSCFHMATPFALVIALILNTIAVAIMIKADLAAWGNGTLPRLSFPADLFTSEKKYLLVILYTSAIEQQLGFMPFMVIMGGKFEPHIVGRMMAGGLTAAEAKRRQSLLSKRDKFVLAPFRLLVLGGVALQFSAKHINAATNHYGLWLLIGSILGWLFYACMLAQATRDLSD